MRGITLLLALMLAFGAYFSIHNDSQHTYRIAAIESVDNSRVTVMGSAKLGEQRVIAKIEGESVPLTNLLTGAMEYDEFYAVGDYGLVVSDGERFTLLSQLRAHILFALLAVFVLGLLVYAKQVGFNALMSFIGSVVIIFTVLIPGLLAGMNPILITAITLFILSAMIILSVAGWTIKGQAALFGTSIGLLVTLALCMIFGSQLHLDGMSQPLAQSLFFEKSMQINMLSVFYAAILVGASGAAMDVAMEMAATMEELKWHSPAMSRDDLLTSGLRVGNAVIGTMTTTLLLAYAGGFLTLIMLFVIRENSLIQVLNMKIVAAEVCRILIGSISLVIVAPVTAWIASYMLSSNRAFMPFEKKPPQGQVEL